MGFYSLYYMLSNSEMDMLQLKIQFYVSRRNLVIAQNSEIAPRVSKSDLESDYVPLLVCTDTEKAESIRNAANCNKWVTRTRIIVDNKVPAISFHFSIVSPPKIVS